MPTRDSKIPPRLIKANRSLKSKSPTMLVTTIMLTLLRAKIEEEPNKFEYPPEFSALMKKNKEPKFDIPKPTPSSIVFVLICRNRFPLPKNQTVAAIAEKKNTPVEKYPSISLKINTCCEYLTRESTKPIPRKRTMG